VTPAAASAFGEITKASDSAAETDSEYDEKFVSFVDAGPWGAIAYQGKYMKPLEGAEIYEAIGRKDLADQYRSNVGARHLLMWGGGAVVTGGVVAGLMIAIQTTCKTDGTGLTDCTSMPHATLGLGIAGGSLVVGTVLMLAGWNHPLHPVQVDEARRLADEHNRKVKQNASAGIKVSAEPYADPRGGAGMLLRGTF
jgi:hypothetical protein